MMDLFWEILWNRTRTNNMIGRIPQYMEMFKGKLSSNHDHPQKIRKRTKNLNVCLSKRGLNPELGHALF